MDIVRFSISRPVTVTVGVLLIVMFGFIGLEAMPIQLSPNVDRPEIKVTTRWPGRSPEELVDQITKEQEEQLKNVSNLKNMRSTSREGVSEINLEFYLGSNINRALQEVSDALRQVPDYPDDVDEPTIEAASGAVENAIAWMIIDLDPAVAAQHPEFDIGTLYNALDRDVKPFIERIDGVAEVNIYGGREREMQVLIDLNRLAQYGLNHMDVMEALRAENRNVSAGSISEGKRDYRVRVLGQFTSPEDILETIVAYRENGPVYVKDVANVQLDFAKRRGFVRALGNNAIAINAIRQSGANVMEIMSQLREKVAEIKSDLLPKLDPVLGPHLRMRQVYDETIYIDSAMNLVVQNLWIGGAIATLVLLLFLRSFVATGVIAMAIPISVIGTFLVMLALGRSLNVVSLAGLAFAVGMVVDNAIVVLENIFRHRQMGKSPMEAAYHGGKEVWGAILASTLTTVAVFVPVLTIQEEAGQLFRDISIAIVASVSLSLFVSATVIPAACSHWFGDIGTHHKRGIRHVMEDLFGLVPLISRLNGMLGRMLYWLMTEWRAWTLRPAIIVLLAVLSILGAVTMAPPLDYLPAGNRNLVFGGLLIPPGYSVAQMERVAQGIESGIRPYASVDPTDKAAVAALPPIRRMAPGEKPFEPVPVDNFFIGAFDGNVFSGVTSAWPEKVLPLASLLTNSFNTTPDAFGFAAQSSLFGRGVGGGNTIDIEISGPDLEKVKAAAGFVFSSLGADPKFGYSRLRPEPANFLVQQPELRVNLTRLGVELGLRTSAVGTTAMAMFDGAYVGDYLEGRDTIDIRLLPAGGRLQFKEQIADVPVATPRGPVVPLSSVVSMTEGLAPQEIRRIEELPSVTIHVPPAEGEPLEETMNAIQANHIAKAEQAGLIDRTMRVRLEGTAAKLDEVKTALIGTPNTGPLAPWQRAIEALCVLLLGVTVAVSVSVFWKAAKGRRTDFFYAGLGILLLGTVVTGTILVFGTHPQFMTARFIWALAVTYLLMCALFESFIYPFVIMFSVPLAIVGGFIGLAIVHATTKANPVLATQNLDVLTMLGFVILIGVVVNNAILIVHQSLNLMRGEADTSRGVAVKLPAISAIAEATHTRVRPVAMSMLTSVGGMLPLVLFPGAGSELYRGLGSVVVGGLLLSTVFTLVLVPLLFSVVVQMMDGIRVLRGLEPLHQGAPRSVVVAATGAGIGGHEARADSGNGEQKRTAPAEHPEHEPEPVARR